MDLEAAAEGAPGAVEIHDLLAQPRGEVGRERVVARMVNLGGGRQLRVDALVVLRLGDVPLIQHLLEDQVAPVGRGLGVGARGEGRRRGDDARQHRRLRRGQLLGTRIVAALTAAGVIPAEVGAGGRLDPVGALAEVDGVEVLGEDLVLVPMALQLVGERRLAELLEDRPAALCLERVLDELLGDGRGALGGAAGQDVRQAGSEHALDVDAAVLVEALVLDRDRRLLHVGRDLIGVGEDPVVVVEQRADPVALVVQDHRVLGRLELLLVLELRQVGRDRHHHPEEGRDDREQAEARQDDQQAELLDPAGLGLAGPAGADPAGETRGRRLAAAALGGSRLRNARRRDALSQRLHPVSAVGDALAPHAPEALHAAAEGVTEGGPAARDAALLGLGLEHRLEVDVLVLPLEPLPLDVQVEDRAGAARGPATSLLGEVACLARGGRPGGPTILLAQGRAGAGLEVLVPEAEPVAGVRRAVRRRPVRRSRSLIRRCRIRARAADGRCRSREPPPARGSQSALPIGPGLRRSRNRIRLSCRVGDAGARPAPGSIKAPERKSRGNTP